MGNISIKFWSYLRQPKVEVEGNRLMGRTSFLTQLFCLFSYCREVYVDKAEQMITIKTKFLWFFNKVRTIPFDDIKKLSYPYGYFPVQWSFWRGVVGRFERFVVSVELGWPHEKVKLFSFFGYEYTGLILYFKGRQDAASRNYLDLVKEFTGKQLV